MTLLVDIMDQMFDSKTPAGFKCLIPEMLITLGARSSAVKSVRGRLHLPKKFAQNLDVGSFVELVSAWCRLASLGELREARGGINAAILFRMRTLRRLETSCVRLGAALETSRVGAARRSASACERPAD